MGSNLRAKKLGSQFLRSVANILVTKTKFPARRSAVRKAVGRFLISLFSEEGSSFSVSSRWYLVLQPSGV
jgi:hypothetical protein